MIWENEKDKMLGNLSAVLCVFYEVHYQGKMLFEH